MQILIPHVTLIPKDYEYNMLFLHYLFLQLNLLADAARTHRWSATVSRYLRDFCTCSHDPSDLQYKHYTVNSCKLTPLLSPMCVCLREVQIL